MTYKTVTGYTAQSDRFGPGGLGGLFQLCETGLQLGRHQAPADFSGRLGGVAMLCVMLFARSRRIAEAMRKLRGSPMLQSDVMDL